jgi:hypothetical protein
LRKVKYKLPQNQVKGSAVEELEQCTITWPSDSSNNWLVPAENLLVKMPNSWEVFGFDEITIKMEMMKTVTSPLISLSDTCSGGFDPKG